MKDKYYIPVYVRSWSTRYYLTHPWKIFKDLWHGLKNRIKRSRCGYAWIDLWNLDSYLGTMVPNALEELAERSCGWPEGPDWPTFEDWQKELRVLAKLMRLCNRDAICDEEEYNREYAEYRGGLTIEPVRRLPCWHDYAITPADGAEIDSTTNKWDRYETELYILRKKIMLRLAEILPTLWD